MKGWEWLGAWLRASWCRRTSPARHLDLPPAALPAQDLGLPVPPGADLVYSVCLPPFGHSFYFEYEIAGDRFEEVYDFYQSELAGRGWRCNGPWAGPLPSSGPRPTTPDPEGGWTFSQSTRGQGLSLILGVSLGITRVGVVLRPEQSS